LIQTLPDIRGAGFKTLETAIVVALQHHFEDQYRFEICSEREAALPKPHTLRVGEDSEKPFMSERKTFFSD
jgi:hypothetical protein